MQNNNAFEQQNKHLSQLFTKVQQDPSQKNIFNLLQWGRIHGYYNFINRKQIWFFLLELDKKKLQTSKYEWKTSNNDKCPDFQQLQKDAERSLSSMKTFENITKFHLKHRQKKVLQVLDHFFANNTHLRYIQGFHDVASIFLIIYGDNMGYHMLQKAGMVYFHDFLKYDVMNITITISELVYQLCVEEDKKFIEIFQCFSNNKLLMFIIPWILTWFSHVFSSVKIISRIWDYILSTGPHSIIYLISGIILETKMHLVQSCQGIYDEATIQSFYQNQTKKQNINIEKAIQIAMKFERIKKVQNMVAYEKFQKDSFFRMNNFYSKISLHEKFNRQLQKQIKYQKNKQKLIKFISYTLTIAIIGGGMYLTYKLGKNNPFFKNILGQL